MSEADLTSIRQGVALGRAYMAATLQRPLQQAVCIDVRASTPGTNPAFVPGAASHVVLVYTAHPVWSGTDPVRKQKVMVHELFHVLQREAVGNRPPGPAWLVEGSAEYIAFQAVIQAGLIAPADVRQFHVTQARNTPFPRLDTLEANSAFAAVPGARYSPASLAVELALQGRPASYIIDYYVDLGRGSDAPGAFRTAFGVELAAFYADFEAFKQRGFNAR